MYADLFTVNRAQVVELCELIISSGLKVSWTCNSRVDYVDEEMLRLMGRAGCWYISWGIESADEGILKQIHKGYRKEQVLQALDVGQGGGHPQLGLLHHRAAGRDRGRRSRRPSPTPRACRSTSASSTSPPPTRARPSSSRWRRTAGSARARSGRRSTWTSRPCWITRACSAERLEYWQKRATREWSLRPGPMLTFLKGMNSWEGFKSALSVGVQTLKFMAGRA